ASDAKPGLQRLERGGALDVSSRGALERSRADPGQLDMVHLERADALELVLDMARGAFADTRVERGRLPTEELLGVRMTYGAVGDSHSHSRLVARSALILEIFVARRERPGRYPPLCDRRRRTLEVNHRERRCHRDGYDQRDPERERLHRSHRNPK